MQKFAGSSSLSYILATKACTKSVCALRILGYTKEVVAGNSTLF